MEKNTTKERTPTTCCYEIKATLITIVSERFCSVSIVVERKVTMGESSPNSSIESFIMLASGLSVKMNSLGLADDA